MSFQKWFPWTQTPLIINAPMGGFAKSSLAIAVTKAGGLGQIGATDDMQDLSLELSKVEQALTRTSNDDLLPIGVGLLSFVTKKEAALPVLKQFKPAVVWLFASHELSDYAEWIKAIREVLPKSKIFVQVSSVTASLEVVREEEGRPDVLCIQGIDAGGHGWERGASIVSLLPEVIDNLAKNGYDIPVVAAGGIADGRGAAAAFTLGAHGVVLGTRFLSAPETHMHPEYRAAVLAATDGGQSTVRSKVFDELRGPNRWPVLYDGRSIRNASFIDHNEGVGIEDIRKRHAEAMRTDTAGYSSELKAGRAATWAGTGVGLVKVEQPAAEIVEEVRAGIVAAIDAAKARL
ncbi:hypothetical protein CKM354_001266500 [Cercospora kikuchii]|uniref:Nitronate monooxygenase domain-containing protein n=1 Tax=Cercospora kikuchii TaxID=84275 RepID=A0A9P3FMD9_9PEZI|nr:uncharacterized protein CKM354_001266500 [Cercospora kikuchii]GIZ49636.1 hypothetical protein CKM354_001266500 [Cercospora kikuchii]